MKKVGDRVVAVMSADEHQVRIFGTGIYEGDFPPVEAVGQIAEIVREAGVTNPRIRLDGGGVVYGCECWWGSADLLNLPSWRAGREVVQVNIDDARREANAGREARSSTTGPRATTSEEKA